MMRNWSGNVTFAAGQVHTPTSVDEVQRIVAAASAAGRRVHVTGSRHSFSTVADVDAGGDLVSLRSLEHVVTVDRDAMTVTVGAGARFGELAATLQADGLALHNLPSLPHITAYGAAATATHGSGDGNGNLATSVRGLDLVLADGSLLSLTADDPRLAGTVVGLGALGAVVQLTLAVEPTFDVAQTVYVDVPFAAATDHLDALMGSAYSVSLFTDYQRDVFTQLWWKGRAGRDGEAPADVLGAHRATRAVHPLPTAATEACTEQLGVPGPWSDRLPHFRLEFEPSSGDELQSEFFVDRADGPAALRTVMGLRERLAPVLKVSEVRTVAADDLWLSTAFGRDSLALHFTWVNDPPAVLAFLPTLEAALAPFGARPHWGKLTTIAPAAIRASYPRWDDFIALVDELDPSATFANPYLHALRAP